MTTNSLVFYEIINYGTSTTYHLNAMSYWLVLVVKTWNIGVSEVEDVLGVMCLHQNG